MISNFLSCGASINFNKSTFQVIKLLSVFIVTFSDTSMLYNLSLKCSRFGKSFKADVIFLNRCLSPTEWWNLSDECFLLYWEKKCKRLSWNFQWYSEYNWCKFSLRFYEVIHEVIQMFNPKPASFSEATTFTIINGQPYHRLLKL